MNELVTDTMALVLHLERRKSGTQAKSLFESAQRGETVIQIPSLVFAELLYLSDKGRITTSLDQLEKYLAPYPKYERVSNDFGNGSSCGPNRRYSRVA